MPLSIPRLKSGVTVRGELIGQPPHSILFDKRQENVEPIIHDGFRKIFEMEVLDEH